MLRKIIEHKLFDRIIISLIIINGITMGLETYKIIVENYGVFINFFNTFVITIFTIEAISKIIVYRKEYFKNGWNLFDFTIVIISLVPTKGPFEILRILRVFRLLRLITVIPQMKKIVGALFNVIPGILSVSALLMIIFYVFAIMTTKMYGENFPQWFGSLGNSFYTLFQIMTLESWSMGIVRPIMEVHPRAWILFVIFVLIATFIMVNLVIAIVVEAMNKINNDGKEEIISDIEESRIATINDLHKLEKKIDILTKKIDRLK